MRQIPKLVLAIMCIIISLVLVYLSVENPDLNYDTISSNYDNLSTKSAFYSYTKEDWIDYIERLKPETESAEGAGGGKGGLLLTDLTSYSGYPDLEETTDLWRSINSQGLASQRLMALNIMINTFYVRSYGHQGRDGFGKAINYSGTHSSTYHNSNCNDNCIWYAQNDGPRSTYDVGYVPDNTKLYVDCSAAVSWAVWYGSQRKDMGTGTATMRSTFFGTKYDLGSNYKGMSSGDIVLNDSHVMMYIGMTKNGDYLFVHSSSWENGIKINSRTQSSLESDNYHAISLSDYYGS